MEIKDIGTIMKVDKDGNLINEASLEKIQDHWKEAVDDFIEVINTHLGDKVVGIFIRGSVSKGQAIDNISDLDTMTVLNISQDELNNLDISWRREAGKKLRKKHPFQEKVEFFFLSKENIPFGTQFILKTQSVCVFGDDVTKKIPKMKLTQETIKKLRGNISGQVKKSLAWIDKSESYFDTTKGLQWICKRFLRLGMLFVAVRTHSYTRDLYPCYKLFSEHYPEQEKNMRQALEYALNPVTDKALISKYIQEFGDWVVSEDEKLFE